jgi:Tol biopolymer transport system component
MKSRNFLSKAACVLLVSGIFAMTGCGNMAGFDIPENNTGNTDITGKEKIYFIKTAYQSETTGTLCYIYTNSSAIHTVSGKTMSAYSLNGEQTKVVFAEILAGYSDAYIGTMNINGTGYHQTTIRGFNPCFNIEGTRIYFDDGSDLYSMNINGGDIRKIDIPGVEGAKKFPRVSPDGTKLAFYQSSPGYKWYYDDVVYLYIYDINTHQLTKLNDDSIPVSYLDWNTDGSMLAFSTTTGITPPIHELWTVKADGSEQPVKIAEAGSPASGACGFPGFADDGSILCGSTKNKMLNWCSSWDGDHYKYELARRNADGSLRVLLPGISVKDPRWGSGR